MSFKVLHCDGFEAVFYIYCALDFNKGGIIMARHNKLHDEVSNLASKTSTLTHACDEPKIYTCCSVCVGNKKFKGFPTQDVWEMKGGFLIIYLWMQGTEIIHDMRDVNNDATS